MDSNSLTKSCNKYRVAESLKRLVCGMTLKIVYLRFPLAIFPKADTVVVCTSSIYIPRKIYSTVLSNVILNKKHKNMEKMEDRVLEEIFFNFEAEYTCSTSFQRDFHIDKTIKEYTDQSGNLSSKDRNHFMIFPANWRVYCLTFLSANPNGRVVRFYPLRFEKSLLEDWMSSMNYLETPTERISLDTNLEEIFLKTEQVLYILEKLMTLYFNRQRQFRENKLHISIQEDYMSTISTKMMGKLSYNKLDYFNRVRHEIFMQVCLLLAGEDMPDQSDVDVMTKFDYMGMMHSQTPDYILMKEDRITILDFAVTGGDPGFIREKKLKKYSDLAKGLSEHLGKEVEVEAVVWKINANRNFFIPAVLNISEESVWNHDAIKFLFNLMIGFQKDDDYLKFRRMLLETKEDMEYEEMETQMEELVVQLTNSKVDQIVRPIKAIPIEVSRLNMSFNSRLKVDKLVPDQMEYYKDLERRTPFIDETYLTEVEEEYLSMLGSSLKNLPLYQEKFTEFDVDSVKDCIRMEMAKGELARMNYNTVANRKLPKLLPFPVCHLSKSNMDQITKGSATFSYGNVKNMLDDGTFLIDSDLDFKEQKMKEDADRKEIPYSEDGIGISETDLELVEDLLEWMMEEADYSFDSGTMFQEVKKSEFKDLYSSNAWSLVCFYSDLVENLAYLEGRRYTTPYTDSFSKEDSFSSKTYTVMKTFENYTLLIKRGSRMTKEKQIRFKIQIPEASVMSNNERVFKNMTPMEENEKMLQSKWLTISAPMIKHYSKLRETTVALYSNMVDKEKEMTRGKMMNESCINKTFMSMVLVMLEGKRGTSTTLQLNRYLLHSATSYITSRENLVMEILSDPIRSRIESYFRIMQFNWFSKMLDDSKDSWADRIKNMVSKNADHDRFFTWSPYDLNVKVEFSILMDCIYTCNLFEKDTGFTDHRVKSIMSKMVAAERNFLELRNTSWSMGSIPDLKDFWNSKDKLHQFDEKFMVASTKLFFSKKVNRLELSLKVEEALSEVVDTAMMMTSSLKSAPVFADGLEWSSKVKKDRSFLTLYDEVEKLSTNNLVEMLSSMSEIDAVFSLFPKAQIGGPREILIQSVRLRLLVKFLEVLSDKMCKLHPKEMLTKDHMKSQIQADTLANQRDEMLALKEKGTPSVMISFNMDASKWAPGFVMEQFFSFVFCWDIPKRLKDLLLTAISSFSNKIMLTPEMLKEKWVSKPKTEKESREDLEWFRQKAMEQNWMVEILSGMGQGMFHKLSSFMGAVLDDSMDIITNRVVARATGINVKSVTELSSDDKTKYLLFVCNNHMENVELALELYARCFDSMSRLGNIHINWKKSAMNFTISEFNSLFSIGRRMVWATIKDIYNANAIPDLSFPEDAIQSMSSAIRRCLEHGVYMTTIETIALLARNQLKRYYRIDQTVENTLCQKLDCTSDRLPYHLGFFPVTNLFTTLIMGKETKMFSSLNSRKLNEFYEKLYSAKTANRTEKSKKDIPFSEDSRGRFWFEMNMRMDKQLEKLKKTFFSDKLRMKTEDIMSMMNKRTLNYNIMKNDMKSYFSFTLEYFVGMKRNYEMSDMMTVHSLVRALQLSRKKAVMMPKTKEMLDNESELRSLKEEAQTGRFKTESEAEMKMERARSLESWLKSKRIDLMDFVDEVMKTSDSEKSTLNLYNQLSGLEDTEEEYKKEMENYVKSDKMYHGTMKKIRFYLNPVGLSSMPREIMDHLLDNKLSSSNRLIKSTTDLFSRSSMSNKDDFISNLYTNPMQNIAELMSSATYKFKEFKDYMEMNFKNMKFVDAIMISDFSCSGNFKDNLKKLMMSRTNPSYNYRPSRKEMTTDEIHTNFLSNISLNNSDEVSDPINEVFYNSSDSKITRAMKMYNFCSKVKKNSMDVTSDRVEYYKINNRKEDCKIHQWTNFRMFVVAKEYSKMVEIYYFANVNLDNNEFLMTPLMFSLQKFLSDMHSLRKTVKTMTVDNWSIKHNITYMKMDFFVGIRIERLFDNWKMILEFSPYKTSKYCEADHRLMDIQLLQDRYTVSYQQLMALKMEDSMSQSYTIKDLLVDPPSLEDLDKMLSENDLFPKFNMPIVKEKHEVDDYMDVQDVLMQFNQSLGSGTMISNLTNMFKGNSKLSKHISKNWEVFSDSEKSDESESDSKEEQIPMFVEGNSLMGIINSVKNMMSKTEEESVSDNDNYVKRSKMNEIIFKILEISLETTLDYNRKNMKKYFDNFRKFDNEIGYHNLLLWQINYSFDFQISDPMALWIYNYLLSKTSVIHMITPSYKVAKFGPEKSTLFKSSDFFVSKKADTMETIEEAVMNF
nr:MAG: RNA-dependent RNA polymerase [Pestalotiopsis negative-stranded RNA virus 1]